MKKRNTKSALISAVLALAICLASFAGTTFAWFTDSVTSANNIIKSGNLDIELEYWNVATGKYEKVTSTTKLFNDAALWEPGYTEVAYLKISNLGSLDLKYQLNVNVVNEIIGKNVFGEDLKLSDYLVFSVVDKKLESAADLYTREGAVSAAGNTMGLKTYNGPTAALESGAESDYVALIIYMPESVDNKANHDGTNVPSIEMGVNLFATQLASEEDSFGPDYDKDAKYDSNAVVNGNATESTTLETESANVEIPAGAEGGTYVLNTTEIKTETDANGVVTATMDITLFRNGEKAEATDPTKPFVVTVNIGAALNLTKVLHNNVELTDYTYDIATGDLTFETTHFSPFAFVYDNGADVATLDELLAALATDTRVIHLKNDIEASEVVLIGRSVMINGNGYKVTSNATRVFRVTTNDVDVILNDVNMVSTAVRVGSNDVRGISIDIVENVKLTLNNCTVDFTDASANDWAYAVNVTGGANHTVTVNGGAYEGANLINVRSAKSAVTVKNATLTSTYPNTEAYIDLNYFGACIWVLKDQGTSVYASGNTYIGDNAVAHNLGVGNFLEEGDNVDNTTSLAVEARIDGAIYDTLAEAVEAANAGDKIVLIRDIVLDETVVIDGSVVIDGNGKTITYTGSNRAIDVPANANAKVNVTLDNLTVDCTASYCERGVNYNDNGALTLNEVTVRGANVTYALNLPGSSDDAIVVINACALTGNIALNVWGANATITANNTVFTSVDKTEAENYAAISVNNDGSTNAANGTVIYINGGKIIALDEKGEFASAVRNATATGKVEISDSTEVIGNSKRPVAIVDYGTSQFYSTTTLQAAIDKAIETKGNVKLTANIVLDKPIVVDGTVAIDLNGYTITYNSTTQGEAMITNKGNLTINDTVGTGVINYNYTGAADPSYSKGNYTISNQGTLTVNGGKITIADLRSHAKYPIDNNSTTGDAVLVINGGHLYNYNTSAIRQFCNSTTYKNSVTINGGLIEGYCAVWMQNPGANTVNVSLTITGGEIRTTAKAYVDGTAALKDVSSAIYCTISGNGGAWSADSVVSITGGTINENVYLAEDAPANVTVEGATFNGYVEK